MQAEEVYLWNVFTAEGNTNRQVIIILFYLMLLGIENFTFFFRTRVRQTLALKKESEILNTKEHETEQNNYHLTKC